MDDAREWTATAPRAGAHAPTAVQPGDPWGAPVWAPDARLAEGPDAATLVPGGTPAPRRRPRRGPDRRGDPLGDRHAARDCLCAARAAPRPRRSGVRADVAAGGARGVLRPEPRHRGPDARQAPRWAPASSTRAACRSDTSARSGGAWRRSRRPSRSGSAWSSRDSGGTVAGSTTSWRARAWCARGDPLGRGEAPMTLDVLREAARLAESGEPPGLATIVATRGSTPQKVGARLLARGGQRRRGDARGRSGGGGDDPRGHAGGDERRARAARVRAVDRCRRLGPGVRRDDARVRGAAGPTRARVAHAGPRGHGRARGGRGRHGPRRRRGRHARSRVGRRDLGRPLGCRPDGRRGGARPARARGGGARASRRSTGRGSMPSPSALRPR